MNEEMDAFCTAIRKSISITDGKLNELTMALNAVMTHMDQRLVADMKVTDGKTKPMSVIGELQRHMNKVLSALESNGTDFHQIFSGNGRVAQEVRSRMSASALVAAQSLEETEALIKEKLECLAWPMTDAEDDLLEFQTVLNHIGGRAQLLVPLDFFGDCQMYLIDEYINSQLFLGMLGGAHLGVYSLEDHGLPDRPLNWFGLFRRQDSTGFMMTVVVLPGKMPIVMFFHPYERSWIQYTGGALPLPAINWIKAGAEEFFTTVKRISPHFDLKHELDLVLKVSEPLWELVPNIQTPLNPFLTSRREKRIYGEFSHHANVARVAVYGKNVALTIYATKLGKIWHTNATFIRPTSSSDVTTAVDPKTLSEIELKTMIQRMHLAIEALIDTTKVA